MRKECSSFRTINMGCHYHVEMSILSLEKLVMMYSVLFLSVTRYLQYSDGKVSG